MPEGEAAALARSAIRFIRQEDGEPSEPAFNSLALELFEYQFRCNPVYQRFCENRGQRPGEIETWQEIPAASTDAFRRPGFCCFPLDQAVRTFLSSGTTDAERSRHHFQTLDVYEASLTRTFRQYILPDSARLPMLSLTASPYASPNSSLIHMIDRAMRAMGEGGSDFYVTADGNLRFGELASCLEDFQEREIPVLLLGPAFSFVHFFDACLEKGRTFRLPEGSRAMDTGGYKGRTRQVPRKELLEQFSDLLGIPSERVINEYGMTELSVQFYDGAFADACQGRAPQPGKAIPHWARVRILDPETMKPAADGETGLIEVCDLSNVGSCLKILTADLGQAIGDRFEVLGRAPGAAARGCSLTQDEFLSRGYLPSE